MRILIILKVKKHQILMKPFPSQRAHHTDSSGIFNFKNGLRMSDKTRSEVIFK